MEWSIPWRPFCWNNGTSGSGSSEMFGNAAHNVTGAAAKASSFSLGYSGQSLAGPVFDSFGNMYLTENEVGFYGVSVVYRGGAALGAFLATLYPSLTITPGNAYVLTGTSTSSYTVSGATALKAQYKTPGAVAVDSTGNVYIPDESGFIAVLNIQTTAITVAGTAIQPGTVATILGAACVATTGCTETNPTNNLYANATANGAYDPDTVVVDRWGNIYFGNKATGSGVAMVVAIYAGAPNAVTGAANPLYGMINAIYPSLGVPTQNATYILSGNGTLTPQAAAAENWVISAVNTSFGGSAAGFSNGYIQAIAVDPAGNVYFTDNSKLIVWRIDVVNGETSLVAGGGPTYLTASPSAPSSCGNNTATPCEFLHRRWLRDHWNPCGGHWKLRSRSRSGRRPVYDAEPHLRCFGEAFDRHQLSSDSRGVVERVAAYSCSLLCEQSLCGDEHVCHLVVERRASSRFRQRRLRQPYV